MELSELIEKMKEILEIDDIQQMPQKLMETVTNNRVEVYRKYCGIVKDDLETDNLQKIFQYWMADRKEKMQDYTPKSIAKLMAKLSGENDVIIDMCAGSGALTIQKWNEKKDIECILYEIDEKVLPLLIFNMCVRNIPCTIIHGDILQMDEYKRYKVIKTEKFGVCKEVENGRFFNF